MAGRARLLLTAVALAPLPLLAAVAWNSEAEAARGLPQAVVSVRDGDLYVGERQITSGGGDSDPDWSPDRRQIAFVRQEPGKRSSSLYVIRRDGGGLQRLTRGDAGRRDAGLARRRAPARLRGEPARGRQLRRLDGRASTAARRAASLGGRPSRSRPASRARARSRPGCSSPGEPFPVKTSDSGTPQVGPRELLPDLDQRAPFRLTIAGTKLGFASATDNVGDGPVWVRGSRPARTGPMRARQLVRMSDRSVRTYPDAGRLRYTPSPTHTHWHLLGFQRYELRTLDGELVVRDRKSGFCLADHYGLAARRVTAFTGGQLLRQLRRRANPGALAVEQGTSIGFTDLYPAHFHGQNLELRGVPAGVYLLVHRANPTSGSRSSTTRTTTRRCGSGSRWSGGTPHVETLRTCQASADC